MTAGVERSGALSARARRVLPGGNTRTTVYERPFPRYAARGVGPWLTDVDGHRLLDCLNNYTALIHGHAYPPVLAAASQQLAFGTCFGLPTETEIQLAELLQSRVPAFEAIRFTNSGTEAVMQAVKAARAYTGRPLIAKCEGAYHGSYDYVEVSLDSPPDRWGEADRPARLPYAVGTPPSVVEDVLVLPFNAVAEARRLLVAAGPSLAAVLVDGMPNRAGLAPASAAYLGMLREVTRQVGAVLILDEVITFRLGPAGLRGLTGLEPDLTTLGKIIGGGFPIGAVAGARDVMAVFDPSAGRPRLPHGGTFNANPMSMVAGLAALSNLDPASFAALARMGDRVRHELDAALREAGVDGVVTGQGSLFKVHLGSGPVTDYRSAAAHPSDRVQRLHQRLLASGVLIGHDGLGCLSTVMTDQHLEQVVAAFRRSLNDPGVARA